MKYSLPSRATRQKKNGIQCKQKRRVHKIEAIWTAHKHMEKKQRKYYTFSSVSGIQRVYLIIFIIIFLCLFVVTFFFISLSHWCTYNWDRLTFRMCMSYPKPDNTSQSIQSLHKKQQNSHFVRSHQPFLLVISLLSAAGFCKSYRSNEKRWLYWCEMLKYTLLEVHTVSPCYYQSFTMYSLSCKFTPALSLSYSTYDTFCWLLTRRTSVTLTFSPAMDDAKDMLTSHVNASHFMSGMHAIFESSTIFDSSTLYGHISENRVGLLLKLAISFMANRKYKFYFNWHLRLVWRSKATGIYVECRYYLLSNECEGVHQENKIDEKKNVFFMIFYKRLNPRFYILYTRFVQVTGRDRRYNEW